MKTITIGTILAAIALPGAAWPKAARAAARPPAAGS